MRPYEYIRTCAFVYMNVWYVATYTYSLTRSLARTRYMYIWLETSEKSGSNNIETTKYIAAESYIIICVLFTSSWLLLLPADILLLLLLLLL